MESWCSKAGFRAISLADPSLNEFRGDKFSSEFVKIRLTNENALENSESEIFLPKGYPDSVSSDYAIYQFWDSAQALCSSGRHSIIPNDVNYSEILTINVRS